MSEPNQEGQSPSAVSNRVMEMVVAAATFALGALVVADSLRVGAGWGDEGPKAGYFPFYIGLMICIGSLVNFIAGARDKDAGSFVSRAQATDVVRVLVPMILFVGLTGWLGLYVAGTLYIAFFMRWIGKYSWVKAASVSLGTSVAFFGVFELWFKVPLIKGPLEALLGLD